MIFRNIPALNAELFRAAVAAQKTPTPVLARGEVGAIGPLHRDEASQQARALVTWKDPRATVSALGEPIVAAAHPLTGNTVYMPAGSYHPLSWTKYNNG